MIHSNNDINISTKMSNNKKGNYMINRKKLSLISNLDSLNEFSTSIKIMFYSLDFKEFSSKISNNSSSYLNI
jgi:hypothetical protein